MSFGRNDSTFRTLMAKNKLPFGLTEEEEKYWRRARYASLEVLITNAHSEISFISMNDLVNISWILSKINILKPWYHDISCKKNVQCTHVYTRTKFYEQFVPNFIDDCILCCISNATHMRIVFVSSSTFWRSLAVSWENVEYKEI